MCSARRGQELFQLVVTAFETLSSTRGRSTYDRRLARARRAADVAAEAARAAKGEFGSTGGAAATSVTPPSGAETPRPRTRGTLASLWAAPSVLGFSEARRACRQVLARNGACTLHFGA